MKRGGGGLLIQIRNLYFYKMFWFQVNMLWRIMSLKYWSKQGEMLELNFYHVPKKELVGESLDITSQICRNIHFCWRMSIFTIFSVSIYICMYSSGWVERVRYLKSYIKHFITVETYLFYKNNEPLLYFMWEFLFYVLSGENKTGKSSDMYNLPKL